MPLPSRLSGVRSPLPAKPRHLEPAAVFSETKLALAIQTLDTAWKNSKYLTTPPDSEEKFINSCSSSMLLSDSLREALCTLLEIATGFDQPDLGTKSKLVTICTARVLGCLKRFVASCTDKKPAIGECCEHKCEQQLLHLALMSILFRMCRESEIACSVVKEGLHTFLIRMCTANEMWKLDLNAGMDVEEEQAAHTQKVEPFDPLDLMIAIDPFDWCYQSLCTRLFKENTHAYFIPVGPRSLIYLLRGYPIPTDEVSEFEQQTHTGKGPREKSSKHRKLPSIFTFPLHNSEENHASPNTLQYRLTPLCKEDRSTLHEQREIRCLWSVVLNDGSTRHLALRSLIALAIYLPRPSLEYRSILRERELICRALHTYNDLPQNQLVLKKALSWVSGEHTSNSETRRNELLPFQLVATKGATLKRMARSALPLFVEEQITNSDISIQTRQVLARGRKTLSPISKERKLGKEKVEAKDCEPISIQHRLNAATKAANLEIAQWKNNESHRQVLEQNRRRFTIRKMCADIESLRSHLIGSIGVLCSGRQHPDPHQPFSEWIKSLPTLETIEHERQYQQEMRQRQILEQQYQCEILRRHERDECTRMQGNDYSVPKECELSIQQKKHKRFLCMQVEMRQFEENSSGRDNLKRRSDTNTARTQRKKEKLAIQERQRLLQLEDQKREGRELERMRREDMYYVEHILQAKAKAKEELEKQEKNVALHTNAIDDQRQRIARMRMLDEEKRMAEREMIAMRVEDLLGRQMRYREAEKAKEELHNEWRERKAIQVEEHDCRSRWTLWERALVLQQQEDLKRQRVEARRLKRQQKREEEQAKAAWIESWDQGGNKYYYNSATGVSQWEAPS